MRRFSALQVASALGGVTLLVLPFLAAPLLDVLPRDVVGYLSIASVLTGVVLFGLTAHFRLKEEGRDWGEDRPNVGIAGKPWALLFPTVTIPVGLVFGIAATASVLFGNGIGTARQAGVLTILVCGTGGIAYVFIRATVSRQKQLKEIRRRSDCDDYADLCRKAGRDERSRQIVESIDAIARVFNVPPSKLKMTDRFGVELGTMSAYDESLDRLGGVLVVRNRKLGRTCELEHICTVRDFTHEWIAVGGAADRLGGQ